MKTVSDIRFPASLGEELELCESLWFKPEQVTFSPTARVFSCSRGKYILPLPSVKFKIALAHLKDGSPATVRRISDPQVRRFYTSLIIQYGVSNGFSYNLCLYLTGSPHTWESSSLKNYPELKPLARRQTQVWRDPVGCTANIGARATRSKSEASTMPDTDVELSIPESWDLDSIVGSINKQAYLEAKSMKFEAPTPKDTKNVDQKLEKMKSREAIRWWLVQASTLLEKGSHFQASMLTMSLCTICDQAGIFSEHSRNAYNCAIHNNWSTLKGEFTRWIAEL